MAIQTANIGTNPNDGTGTPLRDAVSMFNSNFIQLSTNAVVNTSIQVGNNSTGNVYVNTSVIFVQNNAGSVRIGNTTANVIANSSGIHTTGLVNTGTVTVTTNTINLGTSTTTANGYTWLPNGMKMNWGWVLSNSSIGNATFSSAFATDCYVVTATANASDITYNAGVVSMNTTVAAIRTANLTATNVYYIALGK